MPLIVSGMPELQRALKLADKDVRRGVRAEQRTVAEPVRSEAERLAVAEIDHIGTGWERMRIGLSARSIYVAPRRRGPRSGPLKRPNLAPLLMDRAMEPALHMHEHDIERRYSEMLDRVADRFNRGG